MWGNTIQTTNIGSKPLPEDLSPMSANNRVVLFEWSTSKWGRIFDVGRKPVLCGQQCFKLREQISLIAETTETKSGSDRVEPRLWIQEKDPVRLIMVFFLFLILLQDKPPKRLMRYQTEHFPNTKKLLKVPPPG